MNLGILINDTWNRRGEKVTYLNALWPSDTLWRHRYGSTLAQITDGVRGGGREGGFYVFFDINISLNKVLGTQSLCRWVEPPWRTCNITVIENLIHLPNLYVPVSPYIISGNSVSILKHGGIYRKTSNISRTLVSNKIVDNSDVVGAAPTSSFST